jgi:hypothetical protein
MLNQATKIEVINALCFEAAIGDIDTIEGMAMGIVSATAKALNHGTEVVLSFSAVDKIDVTLIKRGVSRAVLMAHGSGTNPISAFQNAVKNATFEVFHTVAEVEAHPDFNV